MMDKNLSNSLYVQTSTGRTLFSVGYLTSYLVKLGLFEEDAFNHATEIAKEITSQYSDEISINLLYESIQKWYDANHPEYSQRIDIIRHDFKQIRPLVILLGGVTGIGKSTIARELASRLGVETLMGTDLIREVIRLVFSPELMPTLHSSSYIAYKQSENIFLPSISPIIVGFEEQARKLASGIEATITRALKDNSFLILEGVHLMPGLLKESLLESGLVIPFELYLENTKLHMSRLERRESKKSTRTNYSKYFKEIRTIHQYLYEQAETNGVKLISAEDDENAVVEIINAIWNHVLEKSEL